MCRIMTFLAMLASNFAIGAPYCDWNDPIFSALEVEEKLQQKQITYPYSDNDTCLDPKGQETQVVTHLHLRCGQPAKNPHFFKIEMLTKDCKDKRHQNFQLEGKIFGASSLGGGIWYNNSNGGIEFSFGPSYIQGDVYPTPHPHPFVIADTHIQGGGVYIDRITGLAWHLVSSYLCQQYLDSKLALLKEEIWDSPRKRNKLQRERDALKESICLSREAADRDKWTREKKETAEMEARRQQLFDEKYGAGAYKQCVFRRGLLGIESPVVGGLVLGSQIGPCTKISEKEATDQALAIYPNLKKHDPLPQPSKPKPKF